MSAASPPVVRPRKMSSKYGEYRRSSLSPAQPEREQPQQLKPQSLEVELKPPSLEADVQSEASKPAGPAAEDDDEESSRPCSPTSDPDDQGERAAAPASVTAADVATPGPSVARVSCSQTEKPLDTPAPAGVAEETLLAARAGELSPQDAASRLYAGCDSAKMKAAGLKERTRLLKDSGRLLSEKDLRTRTTDLSGEERIREYQTQAILRMVCCVGPCPLDPPTPIELPKLKELNKLLAPLSFEMGMLEDGNFNLWVETALVRAFARVLPQTAQMLVAKYKLILSVPLPTLDEPATAQPAAGGGAWGQKRQPRRTPSAVGTGAKDAPPSNSESQSSPRVGDTHRSSRGPRQLKLPSAAPSFGGSMESEEPTPRTGPGRHRNASQWTAEGAAISSSGKRSRAKSSESSIDEDKDDRDVRSSAKRRRSAGSIGKRRRDRGPAERARMQSQMAEMKVAPGAIGSKQRLMARRAAEQPIAPSSAARIGGLKRAATSIGAAGSSPALKPKLRRTLSAPVAPVSSGSAGSTLAAGAAAALVPRVQALNKFTMGASKLQQRMLKMKADQKKKMEQEKRKQAHEAANKPRASAAAAAAPTRASDARYAHPDQHHRRSTRGGASGTSSSNAAASRGEKEHSGHRSSSTHRAGPSASSSRDRSRSSSDRHRSSSGQSLSSRMSSSSSSSRPSGASSRSQRPQMPAELALGGAGAVMASVATLAFEGGATRRGGAVFIAESPLIAESPSPLQPAGSSAFVFGAEDTGRSKAVSSIITAAAHDPAAVPQSPVPSAFVFVAESPLL